MTEQQIEFDIPARPQKYRVQVGTKILENAGAIVRAVAKHTQAAVVVDKKIRGTHGEVVIQSLKAAGYRVTICEMVGDEKHKTLGTVRDLYAQFLADRLERRSPVIAVGGGVVGDTVGFAAASYLRGVPFINIPTTLLAMVDASVGGKTGVNIELGNGVGVGKNLIGAFHQPRAVIIDLKTLATLPERHCRSGMAECVKHGMLGDADLFAEIEANAGGFMAWSDEEQVRFIARNVTVKARVVERDAEELNLRMILNLGHTFAHVIEPMAELDLFHGEAVALGLVAATVAGIALKKTNPEILPRLEAVLGRLGFQPDLANLPVNEVLINAMGTDKKVAEGRIRLIIPLDLGAVEIIDDAPRSALVAAWDHLRRTEAH